LRLSNYQGWAGWLHGKLNITTFIKVRYLVKINPIGFENRYFVGLKYLGDCCPPNPLGFIALWATG